MDLLEQVGPVLGVIAFLGLAVLAFLIFQQAREVRQLREWAGRAPERALEASDASLAAAEARGEVVPATTEGRRERLRRRLQELRERAADRLHPIDRRLPVRPVYLLAALAVIGVGVAAALTGGFGLLDDDGNGGGGAGGRAEKPEKPEVAVLNATQSEAGPAVPGLAHVVSVEVVKPAGYEVVAEDNAVAGSAETQVMFDEGSQDAAKGLADAVQKELGETPVQTMTEDVRQRAKGAPVVLLVGQDDAQF